MSKIVKPLTLLEARILKHWGRITGPKVTIIDRTTIHIMDYIFNSFHDALDFLKREAQSLVPDRTELDADDLRRGEDDLA